MDKIKAIIVTFLFIPAIVSAAWWNPASWFSTQESQELVVGAPIFTPMRSLIPEEDSKYYLGTSTPALRAWLGLFVDEICLAGDCKTSWPTGGGGSGGGGTWSTTTSQVSGQFINYPNNNTDVVAIGSNASTTAEFYFDPNLPFAKIGSPLLVTGSTTLQNFTGVQGTTTNFAVTSVFNFLGTTITNVGTWFSGLFDSNLATKDTDDLTEGATNKYDETVVLTQGGATTITGTYPNFTISSTDSTASSTLLGDYNTFSGSNIFANSTTTNATTTSLAVLNLSAANCDVKALTNGVIYCGTDATGGGSGASTTLLADNNTWSGTNSFGAMRVDGFTLDLTGNSSLSGTNTGDVTLAGEDYLSLSGQQITANAIDPDNLSASDFGSFTCNGTTCTVDSGAISNAMLTNSTISGIALGSNLADLTATNGTLTFSGTYNGGTARTIGLNLGNANTWTALQTFGNSSTTAASFGNASSTFWYGGGLQACDPTTGKLTWSGGQFACGTDQGGSGGSASSTLLADNNTWSGQNRFNATTTTGGGLIVGTTTNLILANATLPLGVDQSLGVNNTLGNMISDSNTESNLFVIAAHGANAVAGVNSFTSAGSSASPTASPANADLYFMGGRGYTGTGYATSSSAVIRFRAANTQSNSNAGTYMSFETTPLNSLTRSPAMFITETGNLLIGSSTWSFGIPSRLDVTSRVNDTVPIFSLRKGTGTATTTALEVASDGFGTTTVSGLNISGSASSTSNVGFNITTGCYAVNGTCVSGGGSTPQSVLTQLGYPTVGLFAGTQITLTTTSDTNMRCGLVSLRDMTINDVTVRTGTVTNAGTADITLYSEDGATQIFSVTTANLASGNTIYTTSVSSVAITAGNYYSCVNLNDSADNLQLQGWAISAVPFGDTQGLTNDVSGKPRAQGTTTISSATPAATISPTGLTDVNNQIVIIRYDN